jgi:hypothetical protein
MEPGEVTPTGTGVDQGTSLIGALTEGTTTLVIIKKSLNRLWGYLRYDGVLFELEEEGGVNFFYSKL